MYCKLSNHDTFFEKKRKKSFEENCNSFNINAKYIINKSEGKQA